MGKEAAFTLIELLISIAVLIVLLTVGIPTLVDLTRDNRLIAVNNTLNAALQLARSEAIKQQRDVVLCKSDDGSKCVTTGTWDQGWIVFHDHDGDRQCDDPDGDLICADGGRIVLIHNGIKTPEIVISGGHGNTGKRVVFTRTGFAIGYAGTFSICDSRGVAAARGLVLSMIGRIRQAGSGDNINCP
ncbi:MAG TPA: GspH/FimT family pseudopilin [Gammaproteobacteria bacterium]|nr:GspH/FimT family pseudopilin [Gammaproteobacteria bacterium]